MLKPRYSSMFAGGLLFLVGAQIATAQRAPRTCVDGPPIRADTVLNADEKWHTSLLTPINPKPPLYPVELRNRGVQGEVRANLVLDTLGRPVVGSIVIVRESDRAFGDAVCANLAGVRFMPYATNGTRRSVELRNVRYLFTLGR